MSQPQSWPTQRIFTTSTGIKIFSSDAADNALINEIWGQGEYKVPVQALLDLSPAPERNVVDLGANRGYFAFYVLHNLWQHKQKVYIACFEGHRENAGHLDERINLQDNKDEVRDHIGIFNGLVGKIEGTGKLLLQKEFHACNLVLPPDKKLIFHDGASAELEAIEVSYLNLNFCLNPYQDIDLLKCDIEGSEEAFLETYPDVLKRTKLLAIEFHPNYCNMENCIKMIKSYGLTNQIPLGRPGVELFTR